MHDVHCRIEGDAVYDLVNVFVQRWKAHPKSKRLDQEVKKGGKGPLVGLADCCPGSEPEIIGNQFVGIARTFNSALGFGCAVEHTIRTTMLGAILTARRFIYFEDQYLVNVEAAGQLRKALKNIQHLIILIPHSSISDYPGIWAARTKFLKTLMDGIPKEEEKKVRVFYLKTPKTTEGSARFGQHTYIHSKTWIFDDELAVIGSANCNQRGWISDSEVCAAIFDTTPTTEKCSSFAQQLRVKLWLEHLGGGRRKLSELDLVDGIQSAKLWPEIANDPASKIRIYRYNEGTDSRKKLSTWVPYREMD